MKDKKTKTVTENLNATAAAQTAAGGHGAGN